MKILVIGAGVLGSLYAARLYQAGHDVAILSRGERLAQIQEHGIVLENAITRMGTIADVPAVGEIPGEEQYDLVLVLTRKEQISELLPMLAAHQGSPHVLFMVNNAAGPEEMVQALGRQRVLLGFPAAGGERVGPVVRYIDLSSQGSPVHIGELDGTRTPRLERIRQAFALAGIKAVITPNMDAWLKTHVALVSPIANALYLAGGDNYRLARTPDGLVLMARGVKEGLRVLKKLGVPITPRSIGLLTLIPEPLLIEILTRQVGTARVELLAARHANHAREEMLHLAREFRELIRQSGLRTPALDRLYYHAQPQNPPAPQGSAYIPLNWRPLWIGLLASAAVVLDLLWLRGYRRKRRRAA
jgi:2-dehydropantoate 2-reductase